LNKSKFKTNLELFEKEAKPIQEKNVNGKSPVGRDSKENGSPNSVGD